MVSYIYCENSQKFSTVFVTVEESKYLLQVEFCQASMLTFHTWTGWHSPRVPFSMDGWWFFSGASLFYHLILQFCHVSIHNGVCLLVKVSCPCNFYVRKGLVKQFQMIISGKRNEVSSNLVFFCHLILMFGPSL